MKTLVIYDITDDRRRSKLAKHLQRYGLKRIQYSGFLGDLNPNDRLVLIREIKAYVKDESDSIYVLPLCSRCIGTSAVVSVIEIDLKKSQTVEYV
ncbi:MAG: CRISPR-associated endonuclease Cas2 [Candidatus Helarchaeota archaeon]